jgi:hypothetical protein
MLLRGKKLMEKAALITEKKQKKTKRKVVVTIKSCMRRAA